MSNDHVKKDIPGFLDGELTQSEKKLVAEHLIRCETCRKEHDIEKLGVLFAARLPQADAPDQVWQRIVSSTDQRSGPRLGLMPQASWFSLRKGLAFVAAIAIVSLISSLVYIGLFRDGNVRVAEVDDASPSVSLPSGPDQTEGADAADPENIAHAQTEQNTNAGVNSLQPDLAARPPEVLPSWQVEAIAGAPKINGGGIEKIAVGQLLETDGRSRARIVVADIGTVDVSPNSRIRLAETGKDLHRLSLERGKLHAKIFAPPRLFIVDTPSAKAVDLGCEYTLDVDKKGDSVLHVTGGWVALERGGRESIVPADMMCKTRKGIGLGTPFRPNATEKFKKALDNFDFSGGRGAEVEVLVREADFYDMFTLWHLLSRVEKEDRGLIFDTLAGFVKPPTGVTREGVLALDKTMIEAWKTEVETAWFN